MNSLIRNSKIRWLESRLLQIVLLLCAITGGLISTAQAQLVNGNFESSCVMLEAFQTITYPELPPYPTDCVDGSWLVSHGTPDIYDIYYHGYTRYTRFWCDWPNLSEGIFIHCPNFEA